MNAVRRHFGVRAYTRRRDRVAAAAAAAAMARVELSRDEREERRARAHATMRRVLEFARDQERALTQTEVEMLTDMASPAFSDWQPPVQPPPPLTSYAHAILREQLSRVVNGTESD